MPDYSTPGIDLFKMGRERELERKKEGVFLFCFVSIHWFTPQIATTARTDTGQTQESGAPSGSPKREAGLRYTGYLAWLSQAHWRGAASEAEQRLKPVLHWETQMAHSSLACALQHWLCKYF